LLNFHTASIAKPTEERKEMAEEYTCPVCGGESDAGYAEANWRDVEGELACSAYCAAIQGGADEEGAQEARASQTEAAGEELREQRIAEARAILQAEGEL